MTDPNTDAPVADLANALQEALSVIEDYLDYSHDGDPWSEDARTMGEMDINEYQRDGRLEKARDTLARNTRADLAHTSPDPLGIEFGAQVKAARLKRGITLRQLSAGVNVSHSVIARIERGECEAPTPRVWLALHKCLLDDSPDPKAAKGAIPESIVTDFVYPPIPDRSQDWYARFKWHDGDTDLYGSGATELDAVFDLLTNGMEYEGDGSEQEVVLDLAWRALAKDGGA